MMRCWPLSLLLLLLGAAPAHPSPLLPPYSGCGVMEVPVEHGAERTPLILYQEPGVARLATVDPSAIPRLAARGTEILVAATARKGSWARVGYDDAGREAWIEQPRSWRYLSWQEFLPGRLVRVLPGMRKASYALKSAPGDGGADMGAVARSQEVRVVRVQDDWALLQSPMGWFRWRDGDGRLTIGLKE